MIGYAAGAAVAYGASDFLGGYASRRAPMLFVLLVSRVVVVVTLAVLAPLTGRASAGALGLGALAGVIGAAGMALLYAALATGVMSVAAPLIAMMIAVVPAVAGLLWGAVLTRAGWVGLGMVAIAIAMLTRAPNERSGGRRGRAVVLAVVGGAALGGFAVVLSRTPTASGLWPLLTAQSAMLALTLLAVAVRRFDFPRKRAYWLLPVAVGVLETAADIGTLLSVRANLIVAGFVIALSPATTILLARLLAKERVHLIHVAGMTVAGAAIIVLAGNA